MQDSKADESLSDAANGDETSTGLTVLDVQEHLWRPASHPTALRSALLSSSSPRESKESESFKPVMELSTEEADEELARLRQETKIVRFKVSEVNQHLICRLCNGYFRDAHTISECLHTFCKSCLFMKLHQGMKHCPALGCGTELSASMTGMIRPDRQMQSVVDKLFPHLKETDAINEEKFYRDRNVVLKPEHWRGSAGSGRETRRKKRRLNHTGAGKEMNVKLVPDETCPESSRLKELEKPYLRTSSKLRMVQLQKYVEKKLELDSDSTSTSVELLCNGEVLGPEHSLEFVGRTRWIDEGPTLQLQYRKAAD